MPRLRTIQPPGVINGDFCNTLPVRLIVRVAAVWAVLALLLANPSYGAALTDDCLLPSAQALPDACSVVARQLSHDIVALRALGQELEIRGRHDEALDAYRIGLDTHPDNRELLTRSIRARASVRAWRLLGGTPSLASAELPDEAEPPPEPQAARCYSLRFANALEPCRRAVQRAPEDAALRGRLGDVLRSIGRVDDAIDAYTRSDQLGDAYAARKRAALRRLVNAIGRQPPLPPLEVLAPVERARATVAVHSVPVTQPPPTVLAAPAILTRGTRRALLIGNQRYQHFPLLQTPQADVEALATMLSGDYRFGDVQVLLNATRYEILSALSTLRTRTAADDQVLIYYAGHGYLDSVTARGYWLPVDAQQDNLANWLSTSDITDTLAGLAARHAMVIADSCFSGSLLRDSGSASLDQRSVLLQRLAQRRSRTIMTSGGLEPVVDDGGGRHSAFASALLAALHQNTDVLEAGRLFVQVRDSVTLNAAQTPQYAPIRSAGHDGGDFIFVRRQ